MPPVLLSVVAAWNRAAVVPVLIFLGERDLRAGRVDVALRRFRAAVSRAPSCFRAHFGLARAHAAASDPEAARRELVIAQHLAPSRFRELRRALPPPYRDEEHLAVPERSRRVAVARTADVDREIGADLRAESERARLRALGPIRAAEARDVDWDLLAAELAQHDE